ncbi:MAG: ParB/RepB/Spo0J family partition protein [Armatimonadota bacterium]|nr:MAG: ParB/RepB/Spo0J family partition protein [Armatimonadota bacterium]
METKRRGLGSLIPGLEKGWPEGGEGVQRVRVDEISANPYQPRRQHDHEKLAELADSMREHGVVQPLVVRPVDGGYQLVAGERRLLAAQQAGLSQVPVVVRECTDREMLELALIENLQREDINCIDAAYAYRRLMDEFGMTQEDVATRIAKSRPAVANTLRLLTLPDQVQESIMSGRITEGHGRALLALDDEGAIIALCERVERDGLSVRQTEEMARPKPPVEPVSRETSQKETQLDANMRLLQTRLRESLGTKVAIRPRGDAGAITIEYYSQEDLDRVSAYILREEM